MKNDLEARREELLRKLAQVESKIAQTQERLSVLEKQLAPAKAA
jgi:hypothetical protein